MFPLKDAGAGSRVERCRMVQNAKTCVWLSLQTLIYSAANTDEVEKLRKWCFQNSAERNLQEICKCLSAPPSLFSLNFTHSCVVIQATVSGAAAARCCFITFKELTGR